MTFEERLDAMELEIRKPIFRKNRGRANEVNYWVFDYPPEKELEVRARIERMQQKNVTGNDDFKLVVFDLYDYIMTRWRKKASSTSATVLRIAAALTASSKPWATCSASTMTTA